MVKMIQPLKGEIPGLWLNRWASLPPAACSNSAGRASNHLEVYCLVVLVWVHVPPASSSSSCSLSIGLG